MGGLLLLSADLFRKKHVEQIIQSRGEEVKVPEIEFT